MKVIFVSQLVTEKQELEDKRVSNAAQLYQKKFIDFVNPSITISVIPNFIKERSAILCEEQSILYLNSRIISKPHFLSDALKLIADTLKSIKVINKIKLKNIWFYNLNSSTILIAFFAKFFMQRKLYIIIADYSTAMSIKQKVINKMISRFDGAIVLNSTISIVRNKRVLPGLLRDNGIIEPKLNLKLNKNILLSGSLGETTGLSFALEFFSKNPEYNLYITGRPYNYNQDEFESLLNKYQRNENIKYLGHLGYESYLSVLDICDITLCLRNPHEEEHDYNFPSKILEYLSRNKFVISTKNYVDLPSGLLYVVKNEEQSMLETLKEIYSLNVQQINEKKVFINQQVKERFSSRTLLRLIKDLERNDQIS